MLAAGSLFDSAPDADATQRFLAEATHHLLIAYAAALATYSRAGARTASRPLMHEWDLRGREGSG